MPLLGILVDPHLSVNYNSCWVGYLLRIWRFGLSVNYGILFGCTYICKISMISASKMLWSNSFHQAIYLFSVNLYYFILCYTLIQISKLIFYKLMLVRRLMPHNHNIHCSKTHKFWKSVVDACPLQCFGTELVDDKTLSLTESLMRYFTMWWVS